MIFVSFSQSFLLFKQAQTYVFQNETFEIQRRAISHLGGWRIISKPELSKVNIIYNNLPWQADYGSIFGREAFDRQSQTDLFEFLTNLVLQVTYRPANVT